MNRPILSRLTRRRRAESARNVRCGVAERAANGCTKRSAPTIRDRISIGVPLVMFAKLKANAGAAKLAMARTKESCIVRFCSRRVVRGGPAGDQTGSEGGEDSVERREARYAEALLKSYPAPPAILAWGEIVGPRRRVGPAPLRSGDPTPVRLRRSTTSQAMRAPRDGPCACMPRSSSRTSTSAKTRA